MNYVYFSWWVVRISGLLFVPIMFYDGEILFLFFTLIYFHIKSGIHSMFLDYIHNFILFETLSLFLRLLSLEFIILFVDFCL